MINCIPLVSFVLVSLEVALGDGQQIARTIQHAVHCKFTDIILESASQNSREQSVNVQDKQRDKCQH